MKIECLEPRQLLAADPIISEFVASNDNTLDDDYGRSSDWIEIYNAGDMTADLTNHSLTDNPGNTDKWVFPAGTTLDPGEFLVVFANDDVDVNDQFDLYTGFALSAGGEYVGLYDATGTVLSEFNAGGADYPAQQTDISFGFAFDAPAVQVETLISPGDDARFLIPANNSVDAVWTSPVFNDSSWTLAPTPFGYENAPSSSSSFDELFSPAGSDGFDGTDITGGNTSVSAPTAYVRFEFAVVDSSAVSDLELSLQWEDGFIAYLNGQEVEARNAPFNPRFNSITLGGVTHSDPLALQFDSFSLNDGIQHLVDGANVLAIHVLNASTGSSDMLLNAELVATTGGNAGADLLEPRQTGFLQQPTPGAVNTNLRPSEVLFSRDSGNFTDSFTLILTPGIPGEEIRFTTNGSVPNAASTLYTGPLNISSTTQVRARSFTDDGQVGDIFGETYEFVESALTDFTSNLPILVLDNYGAGNPLSRTFNDTFFSVYEPDPVTGLTTLTSNATLATTAATHRRGSSSFTLGKNNFRLELRDQNGEDESSSILGMPSESDYILNTFARFDRAMVRNPVAFDTNRQVGVYAPRFRYVEVFFNQDGDALEESDYFGVYLIQENIKRDGERVDIANLEPSENTPTSDLLGDAPITGGYIVKGDRNSGDPAFETARGFPSTQQFVIDSPNTLTTNQFNYIRSYFNAAENAIFGANFKDSLGRSYEEFIDVDSFIDQHIFHLFWKDPDSLRFSTFFYKDRGGKLTAGPNWDQERIAGVETDTSTNRARNPENWYGDGSVTALFEHDWWDRLFDDPNFQQRWIDRWEEFRQTIYNSANLTALFDSYEAQLLGDTPLDSPVTRNFVRWGSSASNNGNEAWPNARVRTSSNPNSNNFYQYADPSITNGVLDPGSLPTLSGILAYWRSELSHVRNWTELRLDWIYSQLSELAGFTLPEGFVAPGTPVNFTIPSSVAGNAEVWYTTDGTDPRDSADGNKGNPSASAILWDGSPISINSTTQLTVRILDSTIQNPKNQVNGQANSFDIWSAPKTALFETGTTVQESLRISEINFNPFAPTAAEQVAIPGIDNDDFEFIEVVNVSTTDSLNLNGTQFADGVTFTFGNVVLGPEQRALVVEDIEAFEARYGTGLNVVGQWSGALNNAGEKIAVIDNLGQEVMEVTYNNGDPWALAADGAGATLVLDDPANTPSEQLGKYYRWRSSAEFGGTPGGESAALPGVVINEVLAHTDLPQIDAIELFNPTSSAIDIGGWYLSDEGDSLLKYEIPSGTVLAAGAYLTFDENDFNPTPSTPGPGDFALNSQGDEVYLVDPNGGGAGILNFVDSVGFDATLNGESVGRVPNGEGRLAPLVNTTFGSANSLPRVGPLIISEVNYHPGEPSAAAKVIDPLLIDNDLEFIEVYNPTSTAVELTNWRLRGISDFEFAAGTMLGPGEVLVVVTFDPITNPTRANAFRTHYGITGAGVGLVGMLSGNLSNGSGRVELERPDAPVGAPLPLPHVTEDEVLYDDLAPWPVAADGTGSSLQRQSISSYGNSATSWTATTPTPGTVSFIAEDADFDGDNDVDGADFLAWQRGFGKSGNAQPADGDANDDQAVNTLDLSIWQSQYGTSDSGLAQAVAATEIRTIDSEPNQEALTLTALAGLELFTDQVRKTQDQVFEEIFDDSFPASNQPVKDLAQTLVALPWGDSETTDRLFSSLGVEDQNNNGKHLYGSDLAWSPNRETPTALQSATVKSQTEEQRRAQK